MTRFESLQQYINTYFGQQCGAINAITADASFRRYYRLHTDNKNFIVMDSDPKKVNNTPYVALNKVFSEQGFLLPCIIHSDERQGFFILSDLGSTHLADLLNDANRNDYYQQLICLNAQWAKTPAAPSMKPYDHDFIALELDIFKNWLMNDFINIELSPEQQSIWQTSTTLLINTLLKQPTVTMHRDYHSRNIMRCEQQWAIIDYQDAVRGPLCYDLVSLLRDCYFKLPQDELIQLLEFGYDEFKRQGLITQESFSQFKYWFDLTGLQRHLKASGIFCRLYLRDGKKGYLANILPTLEYIVEVAAEYPELNDLSNLIKSNVVPKVQLRLKEEQL